VRDTNHGIAPHGLTKCRSQPWWAVYQGWIDTLVDAFSGRILGLTLEAAIASAAYHVPDPAPLADALIAGTAAANSLTVATRNVADFARFDVPLINP
jgi:predicted nucleic acid-binding protein